MKNLFENIQLFNIPATAKSNLDIKGNNLKNILVAIPLKDFNEKTELLLKNILKAIKCDLTEDTTLVILKENEPVCIHQLITDYKSKYLLTFGLSTDQLSLNIEKKINHPFYISSTKMLLSPSLLTLAEDREKKIFLWNQLKKMFT